MQIYSESVILQQTFEVFFKNDISQNLKIILAIDSSFNIRKEYEKYNFKKAYYNNILKVLKIGTAVYIPFLGTYADLHYLYYPFLFFAFRHAVVDSRKYSNPMLASVLDDLVLVDEVRRVAQAKKSLHIKLIPEELGYQHQLAVNLS